MIVVFVLVLFWILTITSLTIAIAWGGKDGWTAAGIIVGGVVLTSLVQSMMVSYASFSPGLFLVDTAMVIGFIWLATKSSKSWPIWIAGMQLNAVLASLATLIAPDMSSRIYSGLETVWAIPVLTFLAVGTALDRFRERRPT